MPTPNPFANLARTRRRIETAILKRLRESPLSRAELLATDLLSRSALDRLLSALRTRGLVESEVGVYSLTPIGEEELSQRLEPDPAAAPAAAPHTVALHSPPELAATITDADAGYLYDVVALALRSDGRIGCVVLTGDGPRVSWELEPGQELESRHRRTLPEPAADAPKRLPRPTECKRCGARLLRSGGRLVHPLPVCVGTPLASESNTTAGDPGEREQP